MLRIFTLGCVLVAFSNSLFASSPNLNDISPVGAQRGTEVVVNFLGARIGAVQEVMAYTPGITVKKTEVVNDNHLRVTLAIAADCRLGEHLFRIRTAGGLSEARTFWVGALPFVEEKEPNSEFGTPQLVPLNVTVHGTITGEDVDYYQVECKKGQRLSAEIEGMRLGRGFWDPYIAILNDKRFELATSDDSTLTGQDGRCGIAVPADGKYTVMLREASYGGGTAYRLHLGTFPLPTAVVPAGGKPGEEIEFRFLGDPLGELKQKIKLPPVADENFRLQANTADGTAPTGFKCRVIDLPNFMDTPTSAQVSGAGAGTAPCAFNGLIGQRGEVKHFKFAAKKGQTFDIQCHARRLGSKLDPVIHISDNNAGQYGTYRLGSDDAIGPDSSMRFAVPEDKEYILWIHDHLKGGGPDYFFRLEVTAVAATTVLGIPKVDGNNVSNQDRQAVAIPKGGRFATLVSVQRGDWGGPSNFIWAGLPPGVTAAADVIDAGLGFVPVVFEAKPDAANAGAFVPLAVAPVDGNVKPKNTTSLDVNFNIGVNNTTFHRNFTDRIAVAVTDPLPFSIEAVEPKAAIPQNGSINIKVIVKRTAPFKAAITIYPLFTPPGTGITGSAVIPEGQSEVLVSANAAPNCAIRSWKTAFLAVTDVGKGPVWTSTQLFALGVQAPMVAFAQERASVEQGQPTAIFGKLAVATPFVGDAAVNVIGLPVKVIATASKITKDTKELNIPLTTDKASPAGKHGVYCQVVVNHNGETLYHNVGGGELRIDVPLPPKPTAAATPVQAATPLPATAVKPPEKRLTKLEQLRLEQDAREKAAATPAKPPEAKK